MFVRTLLAMKSATFSGISTRLGLGLLAQDRDLGLDVGRLDVGDQAPFEAGVQAFLDGGDLARGAVGADDDLLLRVVERVEDVEELLLGAVLAGDELDVVDEQDVDRAVLLAEGGQAIEADGVDHLVDEAIGRDVEDVEALLAGQDVVADGVHQVRLAESDAAVDEERVVGLRGDLGDGAGGGVGELVRGADDEALEGVLGVEVARSRARQRWASAAAREDGSSAISSKTTRSSGEPTSVRASCRTPR